MKKQAPTVLAHAVDTLSATLSLTEYVSPLQLLTLLVLYCKSHVPLRTIHHFAPRSLSAVSHAMTDLVQRGYVARKAVYPNGSHVLTENGLRIVCLFLQNYTASTGKAEALMQSLQLYQQEEE